MALSPGTKAPAFTLYNTDRQAISLSDLTGKLIVLHFFPAAFTGTCTEQVCNSRDDLDFYKNIGGTVFGISADMPFSLKVFKEKHNINFDLLSDFNKQVIHDYDMYLPNFICGLKGVAKRGVAVIGKDGNIIYSEQTANPGTQVNFAALKEALQKII